MFAIKGADMNVTDHSSPSKPEPASLGEVALLFLRLGTTAFGGPAAHIAMMEDEAVRRRRWLTRDEFLDLLGAANLIPGPNSTELALHIGRRQAGWPGLIAAGVCFILPAFLMVMIFAWVYVRFGTLPQAAGILYGVKPVIVAIVAQALWGLGRAALKTKFLVFVALAAVVLTVLGVNELAVLFGAGAMTGFARRRHSASAPKALLAPAPFALVLQAGTAGAAGAAATFNLTTLFLVFLKTGAVLFGSGYVLLAFLRADLVERYGWLTNAQLLDAIAVGQVTPGPVFTTATFVGYVLGGGWGAFVATVSIFLPAFFFVAASGPLVPRLRRSVVAGAFLDGVNAASLALMAVVSVALGRAALIDPPTVALAAASVVLLMRWRVNSAWLVAGGALVGVLLFSP